MKVLIAILFLSGCAEVSTNLRPIITETDLGGGRRLVVIENQYRDKLTAHLDCATEKRMRVYEMEPNSRVSFELQVADAVACTNEQK